MSQFLLYYQRPEPATWVYFSSFLTVGLYFAFHRFWSVRNLDILLLILLAPGILMVQYGRKSQLEHVQSAADQRDLATMAQSSTAPPLRPDSVVTTAAETSETLVVTEAGNVPQANERATPAGTEATTAQNTLTAQPIAPPAGTEERTVVADEPPAPEFDADFLGGGADEQALNDAEVVAAIDAGLRKEMRGFIWLFVVEFLILIRLFIDPLMVRRPLLDPNLTTGGLVFIGVSMLVFLMGNVINSTPLSQEEQGPQLGPGYPVLSMLPAIITTPDAQPTRQDAMAAGLESAVEQPPAAYAMLARILAILAHVAVLVGMLLVAHIHFGNFKAGAGCATLYLMLPYTAQMTGRVDHVLPAALLVWAILLYRKPLGAGICLGLAAGLVYYPAFLLPLWIGFYRSRGLARFSLGVAVTVLVLTGLLMLGGTDKFFERLIQMYGLWLPQSENLEGVWGLGWQTIWRFPILVAFVLFSALYMFWPRQKNLGTLMSCSAALMVAAQFWHGFGGGLFIGWFLSLFLLTIFRPNLDDRIAVRMIDNKSPRSPRDRVQVEAA